MRIAVFEGDGIGPEVMAPTLELLRALPSGARLAFETLPAGAAHWLETGESLPEASVEAARTADAILLSAMGLPSARYEDGTEIVPQIELRQRLGLFAGVRPVAIRAGTPGPLRDARADFVLIRESTEGLFHTRAAGLVTEDHAEETLRITRDTSLKLFRFSFDLARQRKARGYPGHVTCVDKANVFRAFAFFRGLFDEVAAEYPEIGRGYEYVDAFALKMVTKPQAYDVVVTENMFGDILSDLGAGLMGGLGLAPSADIGEGTAVFQPCHGTAPDIMGQGLANPLAMILSAAMMLEWLGARDEGMAEDGARLRAAAEGVADEGPRGFDLGGTAGTEEIAAAVRTRL